MSCVPRPCPTAAATALAALAVLAGASGCGQARHVVRDVVTPAPPVDASPAPGLDPHVLPPARIPRHASRPPAAPRRAGRAPHHRGLAARPARRPPAPGRTLLRGADDLPERHAGPAP